MKPGKNEGSSEVDHFGLLAHRTLYEVVITDCDNSPTADSNSFCPGLHWIDSIDTAIAIDDIRRLVRGREHRGEDASACKHRSGRRGQRREKLPSCPLLGHEFSPVLGSIRSSLTVKRVLVDLAVLHDDLCPWGQVLQCHIRTPSITFSLLPRRPSPGHRKHNPRISREPTQ